MESSALLEQQARESPKPSVWWLHGPWLCGRGPQVGLPSHQCHGCGDGSLNLKDKLPLRSLLHTQVEMSGGQLEFLA